MYIVQCSKLTLVSQTASLYSLCIHSLSYTPCWSSTPPLLVSPVAVCETARHSETQPETHTHPQPGWEFVCVLRLSSAVSCCFADPTPVSQLTLSTPRSSEPHNVPPTRHPDPTQHSHLFVITGVIFWLLTPL